MVLRRPYAFLIKHFRLIHLIITAILTYLVISNRRVYKYLSTVISDLVNIYNALSYINYSIYILIFVVIVLCFLVYYLLKFKDKPRRIYIATIVGYIIVAVFMVILFTYMRTFLDTVVDQKTIRLYRDILLMTLLFQYYIIIVMLIRGLGFDIKKFNFSKDAQELNLNESDSEEVEVNTKIDTTNIMRSVRKQQREFSYFFSEFKVYILVLLALVLIFLGYRGYNYFNAKYKVYSENQTVGGAYRLAVLNTHYATSNDKNYIIINFEISKNGKTERFNLGNLELNVGNKKYGYDKNKCYKFSKYGKCYKKQYITSDSKNYIVVYQIDKLEKKNAYLTYNEHYDSSYKIKLNIKSD